MAEVAPLSGRVFVDLDAAIASGTSFRGIVLNAADTVTFTDAEGTSVTLTLAIGMVHWVRGAALTAKGVSADGYVIVS